AGRRRREVTSISGLLLCIAAAAGLALFYLSQSSHVAATGYRIADLQAQVAELRAEQQQLIYRIGEARSPAVIERRARGRLGLVPMPPEAIAFAPIATPVPSSTPSASPGSVQPSGATTTSTQPTTH
ncbi:MAG TPA: septum formation initiator family protein, partial [Candidatus Limnocylindria bacterium]|nr:septum formation initiator family protein [Candidatus Limnocylindria bacterium]